MLRSVPLVLVLVITRLAAQDPDTLTSQEKLKVHLQMMARPTQFLSAGAGAAFSQWLGHPEEYGQGASGYAKRFASNEGYVLTQHALAFGLNAAMHDDPRYFRSTRSGFWPRTRDALAHTMLTRTDNGAWRFNTWRVASHYGAGAISTAWNPPLSNPAVDTLRRGTIGIGLDAASNFAVEFWPDFKRFVGRKFGAR